MQIDEIQVLYFNGSCDKSITHSKKIIREEHITLIAEPGSIYLGHVISKIQ